jgi:glycerol-3-phosphate acyltransferase PlsY
MLSLLLALAFVALAYLIGSIPFAYLVVYAVKRVDIRTVGSGNVGATNAGRLLGFRYFVLVFLLDLAKGLLPTWGFPLLLKQATGASPLGLAVFAAVAVILGHNFPVFLGFRGGKGVATSLGALTALDPGACLAAFVFFVVCVLVTRYVSLSSLLGALTFLLVHFVRVRDPWGRGQIVMSVATIGLVGLMTVRHRKNLARIAAGTEPKVSFRKKNAAPGARTLAVIFIGLALIGSGTGVVFSMAKPAELSCEDFTLKASPPVRTGHQRAERIAFANGGRILAVTCPRYNRLVLYRVLQDNALSLAHDLLLDGRPMAIVSSREHLFVLERPSGDARHFEEALFETFDFEGRRVGSKFRVGFDPDDMVVSGDGQMALVIRSGNAEGESNRPAPSLVVVDLSDPARPRLRGHVSFDEPNDDPERVALDTNHPRTSGEQTRHAAVSLRGSNCVAWVDFADWDCPRIAGRARVPQGSIPGCIRFDNRGLALVVDTNLGTVWEVPFGGDTPRRLPFGPGLKELIDFPQAQDSSAESLAWMVATNRKESSLEVLEPARGRRLGQLPLRGPTNLGRVELIGLAEANGLIAVADRSGGVHLVVTQQTVATAPTSLR